MADAIQIISAKQANARNLVTGDRRLAEVSMVEGLKNAVLSLNPP
jgi:predicted nucleic acid-binding protein